MSKKIIKSLLVILLLLSTSACAKKNESSNHSIKSKYDTKSAVEIAKKRLEEKDFESAKILTRSHSGEKTIYLTFNGLLDRVTTTLILDLLDQHKAKAIFMVTGIKAAEDPTTIELIKERGHSVGSFTLNATVKMEQMSQDKQVEDFAASNEIIRTILNDEVALLQCRTTVLSSEIADSAASSGYQGIISSSRFLNYTSFANQELADNYVSKLGNGTIISILVDDVLNETEYVPAVITDPDDLSEDAPLIDEEQLTTPTPIINTHEELVQTVKYLLNALTVAKYEMVSAELLLNEEYEVGDWSELRILNEGKLARNLTQAQTTLPNVGLAFTNITDEDKINTILDLLDKSKTTASFFVTVGEISDHKDLINEIIQRGHNVENGGISTSSISNASFNEICDEINVGKQALLDNFNIDSKLYMPYGAKISDIVLEAASAMEITVVTANKRPVGVDGPSKTIGELRTYFKNGFQRGDIIHIPLDAYDNIEESLTTMITLIRNSWYKGIMVQRLVDNEYEMLTDEQVENIKTIKLSSNYDDQQPGDWLVDQIYTDDKVVFITLDDWGSDATINKILNVLSTYNAKATFFVRVNGVINNPNLLKAISERGHNIASHSYDHKSITDLSISQLQNDALLAHKTLTKILGKQPALFYRPPTLDVSNKPLNALKAMGFKYILMDTISTHDYERSAQEVADTVLSQYSNGSIIIMHMSDNSSAAEALKIILPALIDQGYRFPNLTEYLK